MAQETPSDNSRTLEDIEQTIDEKFRDNYGVPIWNQGPLELLTYAIAIVFFAYHMWYGYTFAIPGSRHGIIHLAMVLSLWGIIQMLGVNRSTWQGKVKTAAYGLYSVVSVMPLYIIQDNFDSIVTAAGVYQDTYVYLGIVVIALVLIALLHISRLITGVVLFGLVYSYFGPLMPGILAHRGLTPRRIITMNTLEMQGLFGTLLQISATWVVIFLLLAGLMEKYGGMASFIKGMTRLAARRKHIEIGQVAVAASMFMGSINGSTAANTATTGAFTIPLMKENGYRAKVAAAIEAVASCGGQVLPPIMGAGAFLMAELIDPNYSDIVVGAVAPALLFFLTVAVSISLGTSHTVGQNIQTTPDSRNAFKRIFDIFRHFEYLGMFTILLWYLIGIGADPMVAGFYSILALMVLRLLRVVLEIATGDDEAQPALKQYLRESLEGLRRGAEATLNITILLASLGIVIRALIVTGFAQQLSSYLVLLSGGSVITMLFLAMLSAIAFGMGMSTTAAYMIVAVLVAPSLTEIGVNEFTAHMFVFYFAIVSNITPPIALSVIIGQGIAGSDFWETALEALRIGFPMFLIPFAFFYNEALLYPGPMTIVAFLIVFAGFIAVSIGLMGRLQEEIPGYMRVAFVALGLGAIFVPTMISQAVIAAAIVAGIVYSLRTTEISPMPTTEG
ncbi:TRAP transporter, 4TM/12TM fusion protein [Halogranum amylolyticum]|uniref:TRAP transporter, 4TM/12TM fusion protein n=1 Tax=Halogranum amylolyticum TaxID=660520 RepID=A0A1H8VNB5_9EURY|nr:TRAP transporter fused permease subunit [Halogranum amylolyticum]SEP16814.1 TRAP transporter, 4TM/12TM fusion protein [Halogranum amylolyticum]